MEDIKKDYEKLAEKYKLPLWKEMDSEFEIGKIDESNFLSREVSEKMMERVNVFIEIVESVLQPDTSSLKSLQETGFYNDDDKKKLFEIFKRMMIIKRNYTSVCIKRDEKEDAGFIINTNNEWKEIKIELIPLIDKLKDSWNEFKVNKEKLGYLG